MKKTGKVALIGVMINLIIFNVSCSNKSNSHINIDELNSIKNIETVNMRITNCRGNAVLTEKLMNRFDNSVEIIYGDEVRKYGAGDCIVSNVGQCNVIEDIFDGSYEINGEDVSKGVYNVNIEDEQAQVSIGLNFEDEDELSVTASHIDSVDISRDKLILKGVQGSFGAYLFVYDDKMISEYKLRSLSIYSNTDDIADIEIEMKDGNIDIKSSSIMNNTDVTYESSKDTDENEGKYAGKEKVTGVRTNISIRCNGERIQIK